MYELSSGINTQSFQFIKIVLRLFLLYINLEF